MDTDDPDGFDEARRNDVYLRMVAMQAKHAWDRRIATMTPLEIAESDLAGVLELERQYLAGESAFSVTDSNTRAMARLVDERRAQVNELRGAP